MVRLQFNCIVIADHRSISTESDSTANLLHVELSLNASKEIHSFETWNTIYAYYYNG